MKRSCRFRLFTSGTLVTAKRLERFGKVCLQSYSTTQHPVGHLITLVLRVLTPAMAGPVAMAQAAALPATDDSGFAAGSAVAVEVVARPIPLLQRVGYAKGPSGREERNRVRTALAALADRTARVGTRAAAGQPRPLPRPTGMPKDATARRGASFTELPRGLGLRSSMWLLFVATYDAQGP